ncbi:MAG: phosphodiester glycosidase family protein [Clostridiales bacterium]|nr:phosphodiester glycosidase family protein [Clostridiales bacterium]
MHNHTAHKTHKRVVAIWGIAAVGAALLLFTGCAGKVAGASETVPHTEIPALVEVQLPLQTPAPLRAQETLPPAALPTTPEPDVPTDFSIAFPDYDTGTDALHSFQSESVRIAVTKNSYNGITYFTADIWIRDISSFQTAMARDRYQGAAEDMRTMSKRNNAIIAISGDHYDAREKGIVIRNGLLYRDSKLRDVCVLYNDGVMETYAADSFDLDAALARGAYQAWSFGPRLLDGGLPMTEFDSNVFTENPRNAIGYYEPGHYCFVTVDGRQPGYSDGMNLHDLSLLFYAMGCENAYNLDGGQSAMMAFAHEIVNRPYKGGRSSGDILFITDIMN